MGASSGISRRIRCLARAVLCLSSLARAQDASPVRALVEDGRFARAESQAREQLDMLDGCAPGRVEIECLCAEASRRGNKKLAPETLALTEHAASLARELFGEGDARCAEPLLQLGMLRCVRREWADARRDLERAIELLRESGAGRDPREAIALSYLAIQALSGENDEGRALELLDEADALQVRVVPRESPDRAWLLDMRANVLSTLGRTEDAAARYAAALEIRRRTQRGDHPMLANTLLNLGTMEDQAGRLERARASYEEVTAILEGGAEISWTLADVRSKLGAIWQQLGDLERAQSCFESAVAELDSRGQRDTAVYAQQLDLLARLAYIRSDFVGSRAWNGKCLAVLESAPDADPYTRVYSLLLAATLEIQTNHLDRAGELVTRARAAAETGSDRAMRGSCDEIEAWVAAERGDLDRGRELLAGLVHRPEGQAEPASGLPQLLRELSRFDLLAGHLDRALEESLEAEQHAREHWARSALQLEELSAIGLEENTFIARALHPAVCAAARLSRPGAAQRVWDALLLSSDRVFRECAERLELARAASTPELARAGARLAGARLRLAGLYVQSRRSGDERAFAGKVEQARVEREQAERELAGLSNAGRTTEASRSDFQALRRALAPDVLLVRFCLAGRPYSGPAARSHPLDLESCYYACVARGADAEPRIIELGPREEIDGLVARLRQAIRNGAASPEFAHVSRDLRRRIWDPFAKDLAGARLVLLVPEAALHLVPFEALSTDSGEFLVESGPLLHVLGSEADLGGVSSPDSPGHGGLLALGDPDFAAAPRAPRATAGDLLALRHAPSGPSLSSWPALPHTREEIAAVVASWKAGPFADEGSAMLAGESASERELRRRAPGRRVIHLATHGYYEDAPARDRDDAMRGVAPVGAIAAVELPRSRADRLPFLRSGLVLAGASAGGAAPGDDDGILTTEEVLGLDLSGVEWVVLSACDTGLGEIRSGEGVLGLRRAFRMAGARTVIASLWPVEDRWAREWMEALYRARFVDRRSTAEAVRAASLAVLSKLRAEGEEPLPRRWASFVAVGDWR
jgi:CHAT domain-containing protein/tetratricopeptide (TPR) repeat protein